MLLGFYKDAQQPWNIYYLLLLFQNQYVSIDYVSKRQKLGIKRRICRSVPTNITKCFYKTIKGYWSRVSTKRKYLSFVHCWVSQFQARHLVPTLRFGCKVVNLLLYNISSNFMSLLWKLASLSYISKKVCLCDECASYIIVNKLIRIRFVWPNSIGRWSCADTLYRIS